MSFTQGQGYTDQRKLWAAIAKDLVDGGMTVISLNGLASAPVPDSIEAIVLEATTTMDPLAATQKWRLAIKVTEDYVKMYCATPTQIQDDGTVSKAGSQKIGAGSSSYQLPLYSGTIGNYRSEQNAASGSATPTELRDTFFYHRGKNGGVGLGARDFDASGSMQFAEDAGPAPLITADYTATPFSYFCSVSDHGIAVVTSVEAQDDFGCRQNWFCIQRAINPDGSIVTSGNAPLFCLYSCSGGGALDANTLWPAGIMRFTVRELDMNSPAWPTSAVSHTPDSFAVMNPLQQVSFNENGRYDFRLPAGLNTQRYSYPYEIDMIGYGSADTSTKDISIEVQVYNEMDGGSPKMRKYRACAANSPKNTGARLFLLQEGGGVIKK